MREGDIGAMCVGVGKIMGNEGWRSRKLTSSVGGVVGTNETRITSVV